MPNALWKSHQASLCDPKNRSVLWGNFSLFVTPGMFKSSLQDTRNRGLIVVSSLTFVLGSSFLVTYRTYLEFVLFSMGASLLLMEWSRLLSLCLGCFDRELPFFLSTTSSALIWAVARSRTSDNVSFGFLISESLNELIVIPYESDNHHLFILSSKSYWDCTKSIQVSFERLPFAMSVIEHIIQLWGIDLIRRKLLFKHSIEPKEKGYVSIWDPTKPL